MVNAKTILKSILNTQIFQWITSAILTSNDSLGDFIKYLSV